MVAWSWGNYPFVRLIIPLVVGIWVGDCFPTVPWLYVALVGLASLTLVHLSPLGRVPGPFFLSLFVTLFAGGAALCCIHRPGPVPSAGEERFYVLRVCSPVTERPKSNRVDAWLLGNYDRAGDTLHPLRGLYRIYMEKERRSDTVRIGDELLVYARLKPFRQVADSNRFDYPAYARRKGFAGTAYIPSSRWCLLGHPATRGMTGWLEQRRQQLVERYRTSGLQQEEWAVWAALTLGYKEVLPDETREAYRLTGSSHLLALSGLHVGILYALLLLPMRLLRRRLLWMQSLFILLSVGLLWLFALFTGLSHSVTRSVAMFSLLALSTLRGDETVSLNILAATAFLMLCFRPYGLFDVGFQLSFCGVAAILLLNPLLQRLWSPRQVWLRPIWSLTTISIAAQVGTFPLVAHYFGTFSPYFLLANYWGIPLVTLILYGSVACLVLVPWGDALGGAIHGVGRLIRLLNDGLQQIGRLPQATLQFERIDAVECLLSYLFLFVLVLWLLNPIYRRTRNLLWVILLMAIYHLFLSGLFV